MVISMLIVFAQLFQNAIYYHLLDKEKLKFRLNRNKVQQMNDQVGESAKVAFNGIHQIQGEMPSSKPQTPKKRNNSKGTKPRKEFLGFLTRVQVDRTCHEYTPMRFNSFSRVIFCVTLIIFFSVYWPYVIKKGQIYNLNN
jgi:hypothetical protein